MKRHLINLMVIGVAAMMMLASCKKDNGNDGNVPEKGFRATVEQMGDNGNNGSRTHINPENWNDGTTWPVLWTEGDQVLVRNNAGDLRLFQLQSGANTNDGIFMPADGEEYDYESGPFCAVYSPEVSQYAEDPELLAQFQEMLFSGTTASVSVPTTQVYKANSFAEGAMPMAAYGDGQTLEFKNLAGGLCFPIVSDLPMTISAIRVESLDENDAVSGTFNIDCSHPTSPMTPYSDADGPWTGPYVRLRIREGVTLDADNPVYFTVMVAPGSLERGFTVKAFNENDLLVYEKTVDWSANPHTGFIPRSVIKKVNSNLEIIETDDFEGLTFEAKTPGAIVYFSCDLEPWPSLEYSITGTAWDSYYGEDIVLENVGDKVFFRGNNESFCRRAIAGYDTETGSTIYEYVGSHFSCYGDCYVYGNIMSILDKENFATATTVSERAFYALFEGNQNIYNHPQKPLVLPATTLNISCYEKMFKGCTGLTSAPELPATTLAESCYANMFNNCTSLTAAPELPATTMESFCYSYMFSGCTSLTAAPELPATTLAECCYANMFDNCTSLTAAPELPATTMVMNCYVNMFNNCTGLTSAPELPATTLAYGCYNSMFFGCTGLTAAPVLPATTLVDLCYSAMFMNCTSLTTAPELPAQTLDEASWCYQKMFSGCTGLTVAPELPATTMGYACYSYMFEGCTGLTTSPALPATTLDLECYRSMFEGCTGLTTAPALPAETLQLRCYQSMFKGCTSLTAAPELPATTLAGQCYWSMFENCSNLNYIKCLATNISASYCTRNWVAGVSSTGTFVKNPSMTGWSTGNNGIPSGWTVQDASL